METELWPNLINCAYSRSVPVIVTNGRLSDKSYKRYKMFSYFLKDIINKISLFCMQSPADCKRIISLGSDKLKTKNCGNMKFDLEKTILNHEEIKCLEEWLNNKENTVLFLAGSTHPKEEKIIMDIYLKIKKDFPFLKLVIAARHVKRKNQIIQDAETKGIKINCFSERFNAVAKNDGIFLMDEIGWLKSLYSICDFTFVGGSLKKIGGHNIIEPAEFAKPVIIGPYTFNFQHIVKLFKKNNAVIEVNSITDFFDACLKLTSSRKLRNNYGMKAKLTVEENRGATDKIFNYIKDYIV
jgi:3-deoxy-D-manno-octulosonic-acid transferase